MPHNTITAVFDNGDIATTDLVLFATGRHPYLDGLALDNADIKCNDKGYINVDESFATNQQHIFALGDVSGVPQLTPYAIRQAMVLTSHLFGDGHQKMAHEFLPTAIFTYPEFGTVGLSEEHARQYYGDDAIKTYKTSYRPMKHILGNDNDKIMMKLVCQGHQEKIIGAHIVGDNAAEMVQMLAISMGMGVHKSDIDATMALHPSNGEELVTLR